MPWRAITAADLNAAKLAPLVSALRTAALAEEQADPITAITATVVARIRSKIAACSANQVDSDSSKIPESLVALACRMILREAKDRLEMEMTETEKQAWHVDERDLRDIALCNLPVEQPETATPPPVMATQPKPSIKARPKQFGRQQQDGI
jgi:hypothetical protein